MKVVVDANIVFSAILSAQGSIGELLLGGGEFFTFIVPNYLAEEIERHLPKLTKLTGLQADEVRELQKLVTRNINFLDESLVSESNWQEANNLASGLDEKDTPHLAFALEFDAIFWTGDKALVKGLKAKGFLNIADSFSLLQLWKEQP